MRLMGTKLHMTSAFHPQSDGQTEAANRVITMYLRCFTGDRPHQWLRWLPWAEYTNNTAYQSSLRETPFRPFGPMNRGTLAWQRWPRRWKNGKNSWLMYGSG
jgi:hypothetical protein